jgi:hypothetical protein
MKVIKTREYLKTLESYTHFIFVDAYDTLFLKHIEEVPDYLLFNAEKNCWPDASKASEYVPQPNYTWKYLNSGLYSSSIENYLSLIEKYPIQIGDDDQRYFTNLLLSEKYPYVKNVGLDNNCEIFQSYAFAAPGDFTINETLTNNITKTQPAIIHFNGKCHDEKIYNMLEYSTLQECKERWKDNQETAKDFHVSFINQVNERQWLSDHRTFVEHNGLGFGERSFHWMMKLQLSGKVFLHLSVSRHVLQILLQLMVCKKRSVYFSTRTKKTGGLVPESLRRCQ